MAEDTAEFRFDGWLKFNGLYFTEVEEDINPETMFEDNEFAIYSGGDPQDADEGFTRTALAGKLSEASDLTGGLSDLAKNLYTYQYKMERWLPRETVDKTGNPNDESFMPNHKIIDMFWDYDEIMAFKGRKSVISDKREDFIRGFSGDVKMNRVNFHFDFLLWLLYQSHLGNDLRSDLKLQSISDCQTVGKSSGPDVSIKGEPEIVHSAQFITSILDGNKIDNIEGDFFLGSRYIVAEIDSEGWAHVKASQEDMDELNQLRQMGVAIRFVSELLRLYEEWMMLDRQDQYPPKEFLKELVELCEDEGYVPKREPVELYEEYEEKRSGVREGPKADYTISRFN